MTDPITVLMVYPKLQKDQDYTNAVPANFSGTVIFTASDPQDAERLVACWNACRDISLEDLKAGVVSRRDLETDSVEATIERLTDRRIYNPANGYEFKIRLFDNVFETHLSRPGLPGLGEDFARDEYEEVAKALVKRLKLPDLATGLKSCSISALP